MKKGSAEGYSQRWRFQKTVWSLVCVLDSLTVVVNGASHLTVVVRRRTLGEIDYFSLARFSF